jgi:hypothetical protein
MKAFICMLATVAIAWSAPSIASAADLGERGSYIHRQPPPQVRLVESRHYASYYYDYAPVEAYYVFPPYPYYPAYSYYYLGSYQPMVHPFPYWRHWHHANWGPRHWR